MNIEDTIRREQFCQIKSEISGSAEHLVDGIDVAKDKHRAFMGTATGRSLLRKLCFENNLEGFRKLLERSEAVKVQNALSKIVGLAQQSTGLCLTSGCHSLAGLVI